MEFLFTLITNSFKPAQDFPIAISSEAAFVDFFPIQAFSARPCVALEIQVQTDDVMKPIGGQVHDIAWLHDYFVNVRMLECGETLQIGIGPVDGRVACRRVTSRQQIHVDTLIRMRQDVPPLSSQQ